MWSGRDLAEERSLEAHDGDARRRHCELERPEDHDLGVWELEEQCYRGRDEADRSSPAQLDHRADHEAVATGREDSGEGVEDLASGTDGVGREEQLLEGAVVEPSEEGRSVDGALDAD